MRVRIGGGIADFWTFENGPTGGIDLELSDGSQHFLCLDCVERLPSDHEPNAADVADL